jgi:hypothetical protein
LYIVHFNNVFPNKHKDITIYQRQTWRTNTPKNEVQESDIHNPNHTPDHNHARSQNEYQGRVALEQKMNPVGGIDGLHGMKDESSRIRG